VKCRAVIFDLIGTLAENFSAGQFERLLHEMGAAVGAPAEDFARLWVASFDERNRGAFATLGENIRHICQMLGVNADRGQVEQAAGLMVQFRRRTLKPRPDAVETLAALRALGCKIGLISDCSPEVPVVWRETALAPLVDVAIFSCLVGLKKPDPRIYHLACERLGVKPQECLYVGDGDSHELTGASEAVMQAVLIRVPDEDAYRHDAEDWQGPSISSLKEVLQLVQSVGGADARC